MSGDDPKPEWKECTCDGVVVMHDLCLCTCACRAILALYEWYARNPSEETTND
jgi:hypothetical protein